MTGVTIPHSRENTKVIVKAALEDCDGIKTYYDDGIRVTGKTGASFGLITSSYGEQIIVEIPEDQPSRTETMVSVTGQKEVSTNIGSDPQRYVSQVIKNINSIKNNKIDIIIDTVDDKGYRSNTKEVNSVEQQASGSGMLIVVVLVILFFVFIMPLVIL